jgi:hypothetical protein
MQLLFFSFQGSESSTSEGITKTFAAAKASAAAAGAGTIAVVLLDEVGLAEISPHNPLKVGPFCWQPSLAHGTKQTAAVVWRIALLCHQLCGWHVMSSILKHAASLACRFVWQP